MVPVGALSTTSGGVAMLAVFTLAVHRPFRDVAWIGGVGLALTPLLYWLRPYPDLPYAGTVALTRLFNVSIIGSGMFVRSQQMLVLNLRYQAHQAESEAWLLAEQAQRLAREALQVCGRSSACSGPVSPTTLRPAGRSPRSPRWTFWSPSAARPAPEAPASARQCS